MVSPIVRVHFFCVTACDVNLEITINNLRCDSTNNYFFD